MESTDNPLLLAIQLQQQGKHEEAETQFRRILGVAPTNAAALYSLAVITLNSGRAAEALSLATTGAESSPEFPPLWFVQGAALQALERREDAMASYDKALALNPEFTEVLVNSGALLREMHRHHEALERFRRVLEIDPDYETALGNYGILLTEFKLGPDAVAAFERLVRKNPNYPFAAGLLCFERLHLCDWTDLLQVTESITEGIREGRKTCKTLGFMALSDSAEDHFRCGRIFAQSQHPTRPQQLWRGELYGHERLRIAYVSPDLREHPVGHLMAGVIEKHDKSRFETIGISIGANDNSRIRERMIAAFDRFIDAKDMTALQIAALMRELEVDIAVDLAGYTSDARTEIFLHRPAPIQVNYLGYPGTMALDCHDYIIADRVVLPEEHRDFYSEKPVYLDHCYLPLASGVEAAAPLSRSAYGLPDDAFVFCAFSHDFKIHPRMFDIWMKLLDAKPGGVLWLMSRNEVSRQNLRNHAAERGIDPNRLVFATRLPKVEDHLARYRVADLFLDTWPYNAHTTAADALLAGLPVVTYKGDAFPARVAASLLTSLGYEQLITTTMDEYFQLANALAHQPERLAQLRGGLSAPALHNQPFIRSFTQSLEKVFEQIHLPGSRAATDPHEPLLKSAQDLFRRGNFPQSEIYTRSYLARRPGSPFALELLDRLRRAYGISEGFRLSENAESVAGRERYLLIKAWGYGFWSEVHHLASQLLLAELTRRTPIVYWGKNSLFRREGTGDAFVHFFEPISQVRHEDLAQEVSIFPSKWARATLESENLNKWQGAGSRMAAQYLFDRPEELVVSDFYSSAISIIPWIDPGSRYYGLSDDRIYAEVLQKYLKPSAAIAARVEEFFARNMKGRPWVAVHVRGTDKVLESPDLARINADYFAFIDRIIELNPSIGLFLLTDSTAGLDEFKSRYGERLMFTEATRSGSTSGVHLSGHDGIAIGEEVLVDALLALKCEYFVGNQESNTSVGIASMRDWPRGFIFLLGNRNIRGENLFLHQR